MATRGAASGEPTVAMVYVRQAVAALAPAQRAQVLAEAGIAQALLREPQARVAAAAFGALWMATARALDDEFFGLDTRRMKVGSFALLCHALARPAPLERALRQALRGLALLLDELHATLQVQGPVARVVLHDSAAPGAPQRRLFAHETLLVMVVGLLCWLAGRRVPLHELHLAAPKPAHASEHERMFCQARRYAMPATALVFDAALLAAPVRATPDSVASFLREAPVSVFLKRVPRRGMAEQARRCLQQAGPGLGLAGVARRLALSPATLRRRLQAEGCGWQQLKDEWRRDQAIHLLAHGRTSLAEMAEQLGFCDASALARAFRHWTGSAPGAYRAKAQPD